MPAATINETANAAAPRRNLLRGLGEFAQRLPGVVSIAIAVGGAALTATTVAVTKVGPNTGGAPFNIAAVLFEGLVGGFVGMGAEFAARMEANEQLRLEYKDSE